jgi:glycosyltransferase involved in cell wall biosynthesis
MAPIRVLAVDQGRGVWGAQRYLLRLAPLMANRGVQLVFAGPRDHELHAEWRRAGLESIDLEVPVERSVRRGQHISVPGLVREGTRTPALARLIANTAREGGFDAVWANSHWGHLDAALASRFSGLPTVLHLHEEVARGFAASMRAAAVRIANRTVAVSNAVACGLPNMVRHRIDVVPNGVDVDELHPASAQDAAAVEGTRAALGVGPGDILILAATRLDPSKRIEDLLSAVGDVRDPRVRLVIAGSSSGYPEYEAYVRGRGMYADCSGRVVFCGSRRDMPDLMRASQVLLHAGMIEGMPLGVLEAQSCGVPVVAYSVAGVPESVRDGETGLLASPGDSVDLAHKLRVLVEDPERRRRMGAAARANTVANHDIAQQVSTNVEIVSDMCAIARVRAS